MKWMMIAAGIMFCAACAAEEPVPSIYDFQVDDIDSNPVSMSEYRGKVLLIVNVASKCGFTRQYAGLEKLYQDYQDQGLVVLGFPANSFMGQEPGTNEEIKDFCTSTYGVTFPMFSKISVKGKDMAPLYRYLTDRKLNPPSEGGVTWNFNKFLISRDGKMLNHFRPRPGPESEELRAAVEAALETP
ncbi:MAG TPA: glutathione peroxidase [Kiritimatiellia bacterium]|nr:glutathione peroxidase [Kiritimatiellia bacterium]HNS80230.1 glutathione peroxidase [Kiritimatiellia bacterium]HPA77679.1 glutathione peroxidase [Kiritimatiellia bacterium]HQQ03742.1 glutathione peroxidase [Kiritimatiellia bacterium]